MYKCFYLCALQFPYRQLPVYVCKGMEVYLKLSNEKGKLQDTTQQKISCHFNSNTCHFGRSLWSVGQLWHNQIHMLARNQHQWRIQGG